MKKIALATLGLVLISNHANCETLKELINKNIRDATSAYEKTSSPAQQPVKLARLWIHVQKENQEKLAQVILDEVAKIEFKQWTVEQKPIQKVNSGPRNSELRYFKKQDQTQAQELFNTLKKLIPQLKIRDLSDKYESVDWIKPGHYELWFSPNLMNLQLHQ